MTYQSSREQELAEKFFQRFSVWNNRWQFATKHGTDEIVTTEDVVEWWIAELRRSCPKFLENN